VDHSDQIKTALGIVTSAGCDNCFEEHTQQELELFDPCAVKTLLSWAIGQSRISPQEALAMLPHLSPDAIWDRLSPLLDDLAHGVFTYEE
jgi:hypothetical protein